MDDRELEPEEQSAFSLEEIFGKEFAEGLDFLNEQAPAQEPAPIREPESVRGVEPVQETLASVPAQRPVELSTEEEKQPWHETMLLYVHDLVYLLAGIVVIFLLCFRVVVVSGPSMKNTLLDGDYLLLLGSTFYRTPQPGDVIVASKQSFDNGSPIVKRVIATEGQIVDIDFDEGVVYVDGKPLDEPYTRTPTNLEEGMEFPLQVEKGCIFVMGDNRNESKDSRSMDIGLIDCREVLGKVVFLFLPGTHKGEQPRDFGRIGVVS